MEANKKLKIKISVSKDTLTTDNIYYTVHLLVIEHAFNDGWGFKNSSYYCSETGMYIKLKNHPKIKDEGITLSEEQSNYILSLTFKSFSEAIEYKNDIVKTFQCFARDGYLNKYANSTVEHDEVFEF